MKNTLQEKSVYVCGPLTELSDSQQEGVKKFYSRIGDLCEEATGTRGFVPHEQYDPIKNADFTPAEIDSAERKQIIESTSLLVVVAIEPSWGGGIEVEMANNNKIPVIILAEEKKLKNRRISRLLRGNPAVKKIISYSNEEEAIKKLRDELTALTN